MSKRILAVALFAATLAAAAGPARATLLGIYVGAQGGFSSNRVDLQDVKFDRDTVFLYGARAGVRVLMFAVEGVYMQASHDLAGAPGSIGTVWNNRSFDWNFYGLNGKVFLAVPLVSPYLCVGYGWYGVDFGAVAKKTNPAFSIGAGLELGLGRRFSLLAEAKYQHVSFDLPETFRVGDISIVGGFNVYLF